MKLAPLTKAAFRIERHADVVPTIFEAYRIATSGEPGPVLVDCRVAKLTNCFPMIPSGAAHTDMLLDPSQIEGTMADEAKALV